VLEQRRPFSFAISPKKTKIHPAAQGQANAFTMRECKKYWYWAAAAL
jgi:hypothetical protein